MIVYIVEQEWRPDYWIPRPGCRTFYPNTEKAQDRIKRETAGDRRAGCPEGTYRVAEYVRREP